MDNLEELYLKIGKIVYESCQTDTIIICHDGVYDENNNECKDCQENSICGVRKEIKNILKNPIDNTK